MKSEEYQYTIAQCDVPAERRPVLESYRAKRQQCLTGKAQSSIMAHEHSVREKLYRYLNSIRVRSRARRTVSSFLVQSALKIRCFILEGEFLFLIDEKS
jgi:hypothetical protein